MSERRSHRSGTPSPEKQRERSAHQIASLPTVSHPASKSVLESHMSRETSLHAPRVIPRGMQSAWGVAYPSPLPLHDHDHVGKSWYDCVDENKLCLLGFVAMFAYNHEGDLCVERHLVNFAAVTWPQWTTHPDVEKLLSDLIDDKILRLDKKHDRSSQSVGERSAQSLKETAIHLHLQSVGGQSAQSLRDDVIDRLIRAGRAITVFNHAATILAGPVLAQASDQAYLSMLQLVAAWRQIAREKPKAPSGVLALIKARHEFVGLLWGATGHYADTRRQELEKIITDIEADGGYRPAQASRAKGKGVAAGNV